MSQDDIIYLISCYLIIADGEINSKELDFLMQNFSPSEEAVANQKQIFSQDEHRIPLEDLLGKYKSDSGTAKDLLQKLLALAESDLYYDVREKKLIQRVAEELSFEGDIEELEKKYVNEYHKFESEKTYLWYEYLEAAFKALVYEVSVNESEEDIETELLSGVQFAKKVESLARRSKEDLDFAQSCMNESKEHLSEFFNELSLRLESLEKESKIQQEDIKELYKELESLNVEVRGFVKQSLSDNQDVLNKKRRSVNYFTIAFMGRTKAGKSTLHKVVTHENVDDIGVGKLRTTRYNRCWVWDSIRIIDTPGIGAPGGKTDTETAKSIIDEADIICYVVANDSIQETEFDFLDGLKERNKPLFILLNIKENLSDIKRYTRFVKNPLRWRTSQSAGLEGHIARLRDLIGDKYDFDAIDIIPVQLLAAQMYYDSDAERSEDERNALLMGANIKEYIKKVKETVYQIGGLRKSQNIIDGCCYQNHVINQRLSDIRAQLELRVNALSKSESEILKYIETEKDKAVSNLNGYITNAYQELRNNAKTFSEEYFEDEHADEHWQNYDMNGKCMRRLELNLEEVAEEFENSIKRKVEEVVQNINFCIGTFENDASISIKGKRIKNTKLFVGIGMGILSTIATVAICNFWNPVGWVAFGVYTVVGLVSSIVTSLFSSKEKKVARQKMEMLEKLISNINEKEKVTRTSIIDEFQNAADCIRSRILALFDLLIKNTDGIINLLEKNALAVKNVENILNLSLGLRAVQQIGCLREVELDSSISATKLNVMRDWGEKSMQIGMEEQYDSEDEAYLSKIMQMKVCLNKID